MQQAVPSAGRNRVDHHRLRQASAAAFGAGNQEGNVIVA